MAPVVRALRRVGLRVGLCATAQHRELLDSALAEFGLRSEPDLNVMRRGQSSAQVLGRVLAGMDRVLARSAPKLVLVQGDTTSALGAALAAFHRGVPVAHIEAGLRTGDLARPFPEELNRACVDKISALLFAPTPSARRHLLREGLPAGRIHVTGNTGVDALRWALSRPPCSVPGLEDIGEDARLVTVTLHRQESFGEPMRRVFEGLLEAAHLIPGVTWVYLVHPNPKVRWAARLLSHPCIRLLSPLSFREFVALMRRSEFLVTDSGGVQEEAPSLGKPVLVVREKTERPEIIGRWGTLVGFSPERLVREAARLAAHPPRPPAGPNPFGDGKAAERIVRVIGAWLRRGSHPNI